MSNQSSIHPPAPSTTENGATGTDSLANAGAAAIDLQALAQKVYELLKRELTIERERLMGKRS